MNIPSEILILTSSIGAVQSAFFSIYLFTVKRGNKLANFLLTLLLLAFAVRMTKSVNYYFSEDHTISVLLMNLGYGTHIATFPLLWLYLKVFLVQDAKLQWKWDGIHLLPAVLVIFLSPFLSSYFWMAQNGYAISLIYMGMYVPFCFYLIFRHFNKISRQKFVWAISLALGVTIVWAFYTANFLFGLVTYIAAPVAFSFVMYFMTYLGLKQNNIFAPEKYARSGFSEEEILACFKKLIEAMECSQIYRDSAITLPALARHLKVSSNMLSEAINKKGQKSFPDFVNSYRIREAQAILSQPDSESKKIATIAFETGFNTLSAFNAAFKKFTSMTPSEYRKMAIKGKIGPNCS